MVDPEMAVEMLPRAFALQLPEFPLAAANHYLALVE
jgi:hypothetical protein